MYSNCVCNTRISFIKHTQNHFQRIPLSGYSYFFQLELNFAESFSKFRLARAALLATTGRVYRGLATRQSQGRAFIFNSLCE